MTAPEFIPASCVCPPPRCSALRLGYLRQMLRGVLVWTFPVEAALKRARVDEAQLLDACRCGEAQGSGDVYCVCGGGGGTRLSCWTRAGAERPKEGGGVGGDGMLHGFR